MSLKKILITTFTFPPNMDGVAQAAGLERLFAFRALAGTPGARVRALHDFDSFAGDCQSDSSFVFRTVIAAGPSDDFYRAPSAAQSVPYMLVEDEGRVRFIGCTEHVKFRVGF